MVPDPRTWLRGLARPFRERRWLALVVGVLAGITATVAALVYAHPSLYELVLFPVGVGGTAYYVAHYEVVLFEQNSWSRNFLRLFLLLQLGLAFQSDVTPVGDSALAFYTVFFAGTCIVATVAVDVSKDDGEGDEDTGEPSNGGNGAESIEKRGPVTRMESATDAD